MLKKILIVLILLGIGLAVAPIYIQRGVTRNFADVDDYKIFDNDVVKKGGPQQWKIKPTELQIAPDEKILKVIEKKKSIAFLVIQNDSIQYEKYWRGYSDSSLSGSFSMAKSIVGLLMGIAIDEGKVKSIEDKVSDYIPEFNREDTRDVKIKDVLTMSGGFKYVESYWNIFGKTSKAYYGDNLKGMIGNLKKKKNPGEHFYYSSAETQIIAWVIENAYGKSIPELTSEKIWSRIGAEHDALWSLDKENGTAKAFCCLNSNARDFARLGKLVLQNGRWDSTQVIPADYIKAATTAASWLKDENGHKVDFYGYQFWILDYKGMKIPYFWGVLGQLIFVIPEKNAVVVRLGEHISLKFDGEHATDSYVYLDAAFEVLK